MEAHENRILKPENVATEVFFKWVDSNVQYQLAQFEANVQAIRRFGIPIDAIGWKEPSQQSSADSMPVG